MMLLRLNWAYIRAQPLGTALTLLLLTLGVGTIVILLLFSAQLEERLTRDLKGIDLVVGAKGSPLQLILSSVYHVDVPTGNIPLDAAESLAKHPMVAEAIPLALGDAFAGFRIVGSSHAYVAHYSGALAGGRLWNAPLEVVLGAAVAQRTGFRAGDSFIGSHGLAGGGHGHEEHPFRVVGILQPSGSVLDRLILTSVESVWKVHEPMAGSRPGAMPGLPGMPRAGSGGPAGPEVTALLVKYRSPLAAVSLPRYVNSQSALQAASPAFEAARLFSIVGVGVNAFRAFAALLILTAAIGMFVALYNALKERQYDLAIMRTVGASRRQILLLILLEGTLLSVAGAALGILLGHVAAEGIAVWLRRTQQLPFGGTVWVNAELWLLALAVVIGGAAALLPALRAYRLDIARVLARG